MKCPSLYWFIESQLDRDKINGVTKRPNGIIQKGKVNKSFFDIIQSQWHNRHVSNKY